MKTTSIECIPLSIHLVRPIMMSSRAAASAHFLAATEWTGRIEQEAIGSHNLYNVPDTVSKSIANDIAVKVPPYKNSYLYAPMPPEWGLNSTKPWCPH